MWVKPMKEEAAMITIVQEGIAHDFKGVAGEICTACDDFLTCRFQTGKGMPVFFCEEFTCASTDPRADRVEVYALPGGHEDEFPVRKPENARFSYAGLCRSCLKLITCTHLKPGGGSWDCGTYEEMRT
jgi:hypothetical protein